MELRSDALVAIVDPRLRECLENTINSLFPNAIYAEQVTRFACGADSIEGLSVLSSEEVYIGNNFTDISEHYLNYMSSLTLNDGLSVDSLEPLRDKINLRYLQLYAADQDAYTDVILTLTGLEVFSSSTAIYRCCLTIQHCRIYDDSICTVLIHRTYRRFPR